MVLRVGHSAYITWLAAQLVSEMISNRTTTFKVFCHTTIDINDYGLIVDLTHTQSMYLKVQEIELTQEQIDTDRALLNERYILTRSCLEVAHISKCLAWQQYLVPAVLCDNSNFPHIPKSKSPLKWGCFPI
jgi:hypothetical protein